MYRTGVTIAVLVLLAAPRVEAAGAADANLSGFVALEQRVFFDEAASAGQLGGGQPSLLLNPRWGWHGADRRHRVQVEPFLRLDGRDPERTHLDLREASWQAVWGDWELTAGVHTVFWGVTESRHLVNVVNQVDAVEDVDEEDRLGQPMVRLTVQRPWGRVAALALLGLRERTFPGVEGRLRSPWPVDTETARFESGAGDDRLDFALRWSHFVGNWDLGAHFFGGTSREPRFVVDETDERLIPVYDVIAQYAVDVQHTRGAWLWKLEALVRKGHGTTFGAAVGGFEYSIYQVAGGAADIGLLVEYLWDDRDGRAPFTPFDDDLFVGSRLALNDTRDTQALLGAIVDTRDGSTAASVEAERRLAGRYTLEFEARLFLDTAPANPWRALDHDSFVTFRLSRYF